jgi:alcohol dehydrogenase class IV
MERVARVLGSKSAAQGLWDLEARLGVPLSLQSIGMKREGLALAADLAVKTPSYNPRPLEREAIRALLEDAFSGQAPRSWPAA